MWWRLHFIYYYYWTHKSQYVLSSLQASTDLNHLHFVRVSRKNIYLVQITWRSHKKKGFNFISNALHLGFEHDVFKIAAENISSEKLLQGKGH